MRCPRCNALNPDDAAWCTLCLTPFRAPASEETGKTPDPGDVLDSGPLAHVPANPRPALPGEAPVGPSGLVRRRGEELFWRCPNCEGENDIEENRCPTCGTGFFDALGLPGGAAAPIQGAREKRNPNVAAGLSILPGAGQMYLGLVGDGVVRLMLAAWWFATALLLRGAAMAPVRMLFLVAWAALVCVSAADGYRQAGDPRAAPVLTRKVILYASLALMGVLFVGATMSVVAARR